MSDNEEGLVSVVVMRSGLTTRSQVHMAGEVIRVAAEHVEEGIERGLWRRGEDGLPAAESYLAPGGEAAREKSPLLTLQEAADLLSVSLSTVRRLVSANKLRRVDVGGAVRVHRGDLSYWLDPGRREREMSEGMHVIRICYVSREPEPPATAPLPARAPGPVEPVQVDASSASAARARAPRRLADASSATWPRSCTAPCATTPAPRSSGTTPAWSSSWRSWPSAHAPHS